MEENKSIEQVLENLDKSIVYKTKTSVLWSLLFIIFGIASLISYSSFEWEPNNQYAHMLFVMGSVLLVVGILKFFFRKSWYVSAKTHQKMKCFNLYFNANERAKLVQLLESGNLSEIKQLNSSIVDGLKLRVMATTDGQICFSQVVAFIMNEYVMITPVQKHSIVEYQIFKEIQVSRK